MFKNKEDFAVNDNWLEEQRKLESRVSVWDFDDAKKLRQEHYDDCEAEQLAKRHANKHKLRQPINYNVSEKVNDTNKTTVFLIVNIVLMFVTIFFNTISYNYFYSLASGILTIGIFPVLFIYFITTKKIPSSIYWMALAIASIVLIALGFIFSIFSLIGRYF